MKTAILVLAVALLSVTSMAKDKPRAEDYPLSAHLVSTVTTHTHHSGSAYNPVTGQSVYSGGNSRETTTELQIGNIIYVTERSGKHLLAGTDYPAKLDNKHLWILVDGKVYKMRITGTREVPKTE
jgi:hypothetical protein